MKLNKIAIENTNKIKEKIFGNKKAKKTRKKKSKYNNVIFGIALILIIISLIIFYSDKIFVKTTQPAKESSMIAIIVNDDFITTDELDTLYERLPPELMLSLTKEDLLEQLIDRKILLQEGKKQNIIVTEEEIDEVINNLKIQFPTEEIFFDVLKQQNMELSGLKEQIREQLLISNLLEGIIGRPNVTDSEIEEFYNENPVNVSLEDVRERIKEILVLQKQQAEYEKYIEDLRANSEIDYYPEQVSFVICLKNKNIKFYGADWCKYTKKQGELIEGLDEIYVSCEDVDRENTGACTDLNIEGYPMWEINNEKYVGVLSKERISELSGCE